ncbi:MAG TPA: tRNA (cytidine(56)-2'-O)-methyltransferase [Methanoregulaceae archaeon]|nr:tRNA (cytidine(56)-2'-O)-methyltransferase [Methanoregulaceae archaeon]
MTDIVVLRIGHRPERDQRVTTHVGLTSRALGARGMYLAGEDRGVVRSIRDVVHRWGGEFFIRDGIKWRHCMQRWKDDGGIVVHLTMYGESLVDHEEKLRTFPKIMVVVGAEKVPGEVFGIADYNISITSQPHSEISSLAVFLDRIFKGKELNLKFEGGRMKIIPSRDAKITEDL